MTAKMGTAARLLWLARWVLVLALIWDQVGSPLHMHRHDSGVDAGWMQAQAHADERHADALTQHHVDEPDHPASFAHAVLAVRSQLEQGAGTTDQDLALAAADQLHVARSEEAGSSAVPTPPDRVAPGGHRSLPPEGRAPPLHA